MTFKHYLGKHVCGELSEREYPEFAISAIFEGFESKYLSVLAGMNSTDEVSEFRKYFKWALEELDIEFPNKRDAALLYSEGIIEEILTKNKGVVEGVGEIKNYAIDSFDFRRETKKYLFDSIGFEQVYGLFVEYYDIKDSFNKNENQLEEIKVALLSEIKKWKLMLEKLI